MTLLHGVSNENKLFDLWSRQAGCQFRCPLTLLTLPQLKNISNHANVWSTFKLWGLRIYWKEMSHSARRVLVLFFKIVSDELDGFGGLVVSILASGTRVRGFKHGRSRWIFRASEKSSACLPSEGKWKNLFHVPALRRVKEHSTSVNYDVPPSLAEVSRAYVVRGASGDELGQGYNRPTGCSAKMAPHATFTFLLFPTNSTNVLALLTWR